MQNNDFKKRINTVKKPIRRRRDFLGISAFIILAVLISFLILGAALRYHDDSMADIEIETRTERSKKVLVETSEMQESTTESEIKSEIKIIKTGEKDSTKKVEQTKQITVPGGKTTKKVRDKEGEDEQKEVWINKKDFVLFNKDYFDSNKSKTVESSNGDKLVAPGTSGTINIDLKDPISNGTDYNLYLKVTINDEARSIPIKIGVGNAGTTYEKKDIHNFITNEEKGRIVDAGHINKNEIKHLELKWSWDFERGTKYEDWKKANEDDTINADTRNGKPLPKIDCKLTVISTVDNDTYKEEIVDLPPVIQNVTYLADQLVKVPVYSEETVPKTVPKLVPVMKEIKKSHLVDALVEPYIETNLKSVEQLGLLGLVATASSGLYLGFHKRRLRKYNSLIARRIKKEKSDIDNLIK